MLKHNPLFTLAKHVTVLGMTGLMLGLPAGQLPAWAADGVLHNIRFDPSSRHFVMDTTGAVKATVNTLIIAGRKRVIIDLDNADIGEDLPRDTDLLNALSAGISTVRNVTVNQYGGNGRPIVRVLLDLQGDPGAIRMIRNQGPQIELELSDYASVSAPAQYPSPVAEPRMSPAAGARPYSEFSSASSSPSGGRDNGSSLRYAPQKPSRISSAQPAISTGSASGTNFTGSRSTADDGVSRAQYERNLKIQQDQKRQIEALQQALKQAQQQTSRQANSEGANGAGNAIQVDELKRTLLNMNRQYEQLVQDNQRLTLQLRQSRQDAASAAVVTDLKGRLESLTLQNTQLKTDLQSVSRKNSDLQDRLTTTSSAQSSVRVTDLQLEEVKRSLNDLNRRYELLKASHEQQAEQMQQLSLEKVSLSQQLTQAKKEAVKAPSVVKSSPDRVTDEQLQALRQQLNQAQQAMSESVRTIQGQNQEIANLRAQINTVKSGMGDAFKTQISALENSNAQLEKSNAQKDAALVALRTQLSASLSSTAAAPKSPSAETLAQTNAQLIALKSQVETLNRQIQDKNNQIQDKNSQIQGLNQQVALATARPSDTSKLDLQKREARISELEQALYQARQQSSDAQAAQREMTTLKTRLAQYQDEHQQLSELKQQLMTAQARQTKPQVDDASLTAARQEAVAAKAELERFKAQQKAQVLASTAAHTASQADLQKYKQAELQQKETLARLTRENQQMSQQVQQLSGQLKLAQQKAEAPAKAASPAVRPEALTALQTQVSSLKEQLTAMSAQAEQAKRDASKAQVDLKTAQANAAKTKPIANAGVTAGAGAGNGNAALQKQVSDLNQQVGSLHRENDELKTALASKSSSSSSKSTVTNPAAEAAYQEGKTELHAKRLAEAVDKFKQALLLDPNNGRYVMDYSLALSEDLEYAEAIDVLRRYLQQNPLDRDAYNQLGKIYLLNDQADAANQSFMRAIPVSTLNNYATSLKKLGKLSDAENVFKLALSLNPKDSEVLFNLGNLYNNQNKLEQARSKYLEALQLRPDFAEAHYNLGLILSRLGDNPNAVIHLERFLQLSPSAKNAETIRTYIQKLKA